MKKFFTLLLLTTATLVMYAQQKEVSGVVVDSKGEPIIQASVIAKGTTIGTATDIDGKFKMEVPASVKTLVVTYIGMEKKRSCSRQESENCAHRKRRSAPGSGCHRFR